MTTFLLYYFVCALVVFAAYLFLIRGYSTFHGTLWSFVMSLIWPITLTVVLLFIRIGYQHKKHGEEINKSIENYKK